MSPQDTSHDDVEKRAHSPTAPGPDIAPDSTTPVAPDHDIEDTPSISSQPSENVFLLWTRRVERIAGLEARGIRRVEPHEKTEKATLNPLQIVLLWLGVNTAPQNITLAMLGSSVYGLGFRDAALCSVFGGVVGSLATSYTATWGPLSGNRTMVSC